MRTELVVRGEEGVLVEVDQVIAAHFERLVAEDIVSRELEDEWGVPLSYEDGNPVVVGSFDPGREPLKQEQVCLVKTFRSNGQWLDVSFRVHQGVDAEARLVLKSGWK